MKFLTIICYSFLAASMAFGSLYSYPDDKRPAVSLKEACGIAERLLEKIGLNDDFYVTSVSIYGDKEQTGAGAWNLMYHNTRGDKVHVFIQLDEDFCTTSFTPKEGKASEAGFRRDGSVSPKWLEWQERMKKMKEESDRQFPDDAPTSKKKTAEPNKP